MAREDDHFNKLVNFKFSTKDQNIFVTSDPHFSHENIIGFCERPFKNADEMNEEIIKRWNNVVKPNDIVFILGDFCWGGSQVWNNILDRLNGRKYLILGNHDEKNIRQGYFNKFEYVGYEMHVYIDDVSIYLNHYPFLCYGGSYRTNKKPVIQLFGHVHSRNLSVYRHLKKKTKKGATSRDQHRLSVLFPTQYDVGMDNNNYTPVSFKEIMEIIEYQKTHGVIKRKILAWILKLFEIF